MKSDREKLQELLNRTDGSFESIVLAYMIKNKQEFDTERTVEFIEKINKNVLKPLIEIDARAVRVAKERAGYLKTYLEGNMYTTKEAEEINKPAQINNTKAILNSGYSRETINALTDIKEGIEGNYNEKDTVNEEATIALIGNSLEASTAH